MKKQTFGIRAPVWTLAFCLLTLVFAGCGDPESTSSPPPAQEPEIVTPHLKSLSITYNGEEDTSLLEKAFAPKASSYSARVADGAKAKTINLKIETPDAIDYKLLTKEIKKYKVSTKGIWEEVRGPPDDEDGNPGKPLTVKPDLKSLPVPELDPTFNLDSLPGDEGYSTYQLKFELSLKPDAPASYQENGITYQYDSSPKTIIVYIREPKPDSVDMNDPAVKDKVNNTITEAENQLNQFKIYVGNPASTDEGGDNDPRVVYINTVMDDLNALKDGITEYLYFETQTPPTDSTLKVDDADKLEAKNGAGWCEIAWDSQEPPQPIAYLVKQPNQVYDVEGILLKAKELVLAVEDCIANKIDKLVMKKVRFNYKAPVDADDPNVQDVLVASNGKYQIELVGGSGGHVWTASDYTTTGGKAARLSARFTLAKENKLGFRVGGEGIGAANLATLNDPTIKNATKAVQRTALHNNWANKADWCSTKDGGWNGGGTGGASAADKGEGSNWYAPGSSGGGASDVRIYDGEILSSSWTYGDNDPRIMVAAGGGGSAQSSNGSTKAFEGGAAGVNGVIINNNIRQGIALETKQSDTGISYTPYTWDPCPPGHPNYQKDPSPNGDDGASRPNGLYEGNGGGGGGFKGGEAFTAVGYKGSAAGIGIGTGAGGSSHIKSGATNTIQTTYDQFGSGYAIIEWKSK